MIRTLTLAAVAMLIAAPASAQSVKLDLTGKSNTEIQVDIAKAVHKVCVQAVAGATFRRQAYDACVKATAARADAQLSAAQLAAAPGAASQVARN